MGAVIMIPVYNAPAALQQCLDSVLAHTDPAVPLLLLDDASPDPAIAPILSAAAERRPGTEVLRNAQNLGFVRSCNRAFAHCARSDVLLLNSDTVVTPGWFEALARCMASDPRLASATPWSNHAEIASLPGFCVANPVPVDPARWAWACQTGQPEYPRLPTAIGFCMWVARRALDRIGDFDADTFGRGYGEENDWCCRALGHGFEHALCDDAYVVHVGGQSFGPLGEKPGGTALARLSARYPHYTGAVARFIQADPLAHRRARICERFEGSSDESN